MMEEALRRRALESLGPLGHPVAREVLETSALEVECGVSAWQGSEGLVHAHRVALWIDPDLYACAVALPAVTDALTEAVAAAISVEPLEALAELRLAPRRMPPHDHPYRG